MMKHAILIAALLPLAACTSTTAPVATTPAPVAGSSYEQMSCAELAAAARERDSDAAWARRQQQQTFSGDTTSNVTVSFPTGGGRPSAGAPTTRASQDRATIRSVMAAKNCG